MSAIFFLIGISLVVAIGFLAAFLWAVSQGQYEDSYTPSVRMLWEDKPTVSEALPSAPESTSTPGTRKHL